MTIRVKVLYFGQARELAGTSSEGVSLPANSKVKDLVRASARSHKGLPKLSTVVAINEEVAREEDLLEDGDVVAFLPPVAGG